MGKIADKNRADFEKWKREMEANGYTFNPPPRPEWHRKRHPHLSDDCYNRYVTPDEWDEAIDEYHADDWVGNVIGWIAIIIGGLYICVRW